MDPYKITFADPVRGNKHNHSYSTAVHVHVAAAANFRAPKAGRGSADHAVTTPARFCDHVLALAMSDEDEGVQEPPPQAAEPQAEAGTPAAEGGDWGWGSDQEPEV